MQVDAEGIAERHRKSFMENALAEFEPIFSQLKFSSPSSQEAEWTKVRGLEFREALEARDALAKELAFYSITSLDTFDESVSSPSCFQRILISDPSHFES
jgi:antiviral helicase SKI2